MSHKRLINHLNYFFSPQSNLNLFDVGSCDGEDAITYSRLFPKAKIFAFEATSSNFNLLLKNLAEKNAGTVRAFNIALSDKNGVSEIFLSRTNKAQVPESLKEMPLELIGNKSSSLLPPLEHTEHYPWIEFTEKEKVQTLRLDEFCRQNQLKTIDFLHLDVQGAELMVLEGAKHLLENTRLIWMEVSQVFYYKNQPLKKDIENFMESNNFMLLYDAIHFPHGDRLYVNKNFYSKNYCSYQLKKWTGFLRRF